MTRLRRPAFRAHNRTSRNNQTSRTATPPARAARTTAAVLATGAVLAAGLAAPTQASQAVQAATPADYCGGQCADIVPPGQNGNATFTDLLLFKGFGTRPAHFSDTLKPYENLVWNSQGITDDQL
ncbi:MAG TPA: hypothetical protein VGD71_14130, partial [Kribbella sp.]